jgi:hypothetical protein
LQDLGEQKVDFEETWAFPYEAFEGWDEADVVTAGVGEAFA